ncbi:MAG: sodium-translocating pyrophosphatase [Candidatus Altiarchaeales archaeon]|nr:sodium-translocating pyrophosphatase [Candidatus Altiarchaeales archaeon]MBD3416325.1 sodium-translocating pyrophosphatase [Candidatus Altiarchaeales archaeon]
MKMIIFYAIAASLLALLLAGLKMKNVFSQPEGSERMKEIAEAIHQGSMAFLNREYKTLILFVVVVAAVLAAFLNVNTAVTFVVGAIFSAAAGNIGMRVATAANVRTAQASSETLQKGLKTAFSSGLIMGLCVVGLGVLGVSALYLYFGDPEIIYGFGFGASSIALFARVGGGIYTKGADVGADLVGKVEAGIPEDDPRNPATIADNVGDNVGDVAGMGADLFESYVDSIIATMALGVAITATGNGHVLLPLAVAATGIVMSIVGSFFVGGDKPEKALDRGIWIAAILAAVVMYFVVIYVLGPEHSNIYYAVLAGLVSGVVIGKITEYYTSAEYGPTREVSKAAETGAGTNVIAGLGLGMFSTLIPVLVVCAAIIISYQVAGIYGIAIAAVGMLSTLGITLASDTYGPVADNAAGIAEMASMGGQVRERCEQLDAVGNTTAAIGKGFAIGSAALTALALFVAYTQAAELSSIDVMKPTVTVGLFIGGLLPFLFSSYAMDAVGKAAEQMVEEVRRQFKEIPGLMEGKAKADYNRCVDISTTAALKAMVKPSVLAVLTPLVVGLALGSEALGGLLAGTVVTGFLLAVTMANSGGSWDNAKKYIESGNLGGKGSDAHKAAVVGDTVGDPFKDTAGPSLNILIKLVSIVALVFAPLF